MQVRDAQKNWTAAENGKTRADYAALDDYVRRLKELRDTYKTLTPAQVRQSLSEITSEFNHHPRWKVQVSCQYHHSLKIGTG